MMDVSVKTLDGHNRSYSMPDDVTVKQFKEKIANSINIPVDKQRLIFQGKVLQDDKLLKDYDVNGKVIHVVQRAPPATSQSNSNGGSRGNVGAEPPVDRPRDASNVFIGSFTLPSDIIDPTQVQQIVQEAVTGLGDLGRNARVSTRTSTDGAAIDVQINLGQIPADNVESESRQRLMQARRMIRLANETVGRLENSLERRTEETGASSSRNSTATSLNQTETSESVTETLSVSVDSPAEAQSTSSGSPMDISETSDTDESLARQMDRIEARTEERTQTTDLTSNETVQESRTTEPEAQTGTTTSNQTSENPATEGSSQSRTADTTQTENQRPEASNQNRGPLRPSISELGQVLQEAQELNRRMEPYLERFQRIVMEDAVIPENEIQAAQRICNMMADVLHATSHGYHCLSDLMVDLGQRPPRQLYAALAVPTSTVIQQTIPVQAQISVPVNMSAAAANLQARLASQATTSSTTSTTSTTSSQATPSQPSQASSTSTTSNTTSSVPSVPSSTIGSRASEREGRIPVSMPLSNSGSTTTSSNPYVFLEVGPEHITVNSISAHVVTTTERRMESDNDSDGAFVATGTSVSDTNTGNASTMSTTTTSTTETPVPAELIPQLLQSIAQSAGLPPQDGQHQPMQMNFQPFPPGSSGMSPRTIDIPPPSLNMRYQFMPSDFGLSPDPFESQRRTTELLSASMQNRLAFSEDADIGNPDSAQTNSSATQTRPTSVSSSGVQTRTNPISNSGTQTPGVQHRAAAFVMPGFPGLHGMMPRGIRPVDPYLPCMSRHFLTQQARNLANEPQPQSGETALVDMVGNLMLGLLGQTNPHTHGQPAGSSPASATPTEQPGSTSGRGIFPGFLPRGMGMPPGMRNPRFMPGFRVGVQRTPAAGRGQRSTTQSTQNPQEPQFVNDLRTLLQHAGQAAVVTIQESQNSRATTTSTGGSSTSSTTATTTTTTQSSTSQPSMARSLSDEAFTQLVLGISTVMSQAAMGAAPQVNMAEFLSSLGESYNVPQGEGLINDLMNCVLTHLQITDLLQVFNGVPAPLNRVHAPLQNFVREEVLQKAEVNAVNIQTHIKRLIERMQDEIRETVAQAEVRPNIDFFATLNGFLTNHLILLTNLIMNTQSGDQSFGTNLYNSVRTFFTELVKLCACCLVRGLPGFQTLLCNRIQSLSQGVNPMIQQWMVSMTAQQLASFLPSITVTEQQVSHYIVHCTSSDKPAESATSASEGTAESVLDASSSIPMGTELPRVTPGAVELNIDVKEAKPSTGSPNTKPSEGRKCEIGAIRETASPVSQASANEGPQEAVNGMEDWMTVVPEDWVPVITRDIQRQRQQRPQNPHSDAYLQGMPPKRRRLMTQDRPENLGSASEILPDSIRRAVAAAGVEPISSMENLTNEAAENTELQNAFEEEVCSVVRDRLQDEPDFVPERFPNTNDFCKKANSSKKCNETCL